MSNEPLVSIVIDNYNYARFLPYAIDSALQQTYRNIEVIVVDDGSTDGSREIIASYEDRIIPVLKPNGGQASAFNAGFARSRGHVVIFLDADDVLLPATIACVVKAMVDNPDVAKVQYRMHVIDETGAQTGEIKPPEHRTLRSGDLRRHFVTFPDDMTWMATSGNAFSARVLTEILPIPEEVYVLGADWYLSHITPLFGPVMSLDMVGAYYRMHGANNYEVSALSVQQMRQTIGYMVTTHLYIKKFADQLGLADRQKTERDILSVSWVANRLVSLKLDPARHPVQDDSVWKLVMEGIRASWRHFDVSWGMKLTYTVWLLAMSSAPRPLATGLAERFFYPEARERWNKLLAALQGA
jgi:glycosyltransferase involved in cell wall biosynthesis